MATYPGFVPLSIAGSLVNENITDELSEYAVDAWPPHESDILQLTATTGRGANAPIPGTAHVRAGSVANSYLQDYYFRVHVVPQVINLGNIASERIETVEVWNAQFVANELTSITEEGADGITLTGPVAPPTTYAPLESRLYSLRVGVDGAPAIDALHTFTFTLDTATLRTITNRVVPWTWQPNWETPVLERMEWVTDVLQAHDGSEQRISLRLGPRKSYEFATWFSGRDRRAAEAAIWGWGANVWALPIWPDGVDLPDGLAAGAISVSLDTEGRDFVAGSLAIVMTDANNSETAEVEAVTSTSVTFKRPLIRQWPAGARIYPARAARLQDSVQLPRWTGQVSDARVIFEVEGPVDGAAAAPATTYRGKPVLEARPEWSETPSVEMQRKLARLDPGIGARFFDDEAGMPMAAQRQGYTLVSKAEALVHRGYLYALNGRQAGMWVPTWTDDLVIVTDTLSESIEIEIENIGYTRLIAQSVNRRDIRIELTDGTVLYRRIIGSEELDADTERLALDASLGRLVRPEEVVQVSFMMYARLDSDAVEISHWTGDVADTVLVFKGVRHGV